MPTIVEIGSLRERVELIDAPDARGRVGRIRHANGESASIDFRTLEALRERARMARDQPAGRRSQVRFTGLLQA